jgi:hypothetical protein
MARSNSEIAVELRTKFEFYLLGLILAVLGLSIQTAKFGNSVVADLFELAGWLALFLSGVIGLLRGEWIPIVHSIQSKVESTETRLSQIQAEIDQPVTFVEDDGQEVTINGEEALARLRGTVADLEQQRRSAEKKILTRYGWMKYSFLVGIAALMVARAYPHARAVSEAICTCFK